VRETNQEDVLERLTQTASRVQAAGISPVGKEVLLPFEQMDEYDFERLCSRLASRQADVEGARRYGIRFDAQYGIDIYARWRNKPRYCVYQCKRYQKITEKNLEEIIEKFVEDRKKNNAPEWLKQANKFVLCVTQPLEQARFTNVVETKYQGLNATLELDVWDTIKLTELLKSEPEVVEEFFGHEASEKICNRTSMLEIKAKLEYDPDVFGPSQLLVASNRVVPFAGRKDLTQELLNWSQTNPKFAAKLISGAGGMGKTRFMLELASTLHGHGWLAGFVRDQDARAQQQPEWQTLLERDLPTLIVMDYAETRESTLLALLGMAQQCYQQRQHPIRIVMLARADEQSEWFENLKKQPMLSKATAIALPAPDTLENLEQRQQAFHDAAQAFNAALKRPEAAPTSTNVNLERPIFERVLFVHMLALLACERVHLNDQAGGVEVIDAILERERQHWRRHLNAHPSNLDNPENRQGVELMLGLVTLGYLVSNLSEGQTLIEQVPVIGKDLADGPKQFLIKRLHAMYPGPRYLNAIEPDLIAERLVQCTLEHPDHGEDMLKFAFGKAGAEPDLLRVNPDQALAHLVRLAEWQPAALELWQKVFAGRLNNVWTDISDTPKVHSVLDANLASWISMHLAYHRSDTPLLWTSMDVAQETQINGSKLGDLLANTLEISEDRALAIRTKERLPNYSVNLLKLVEVVKRMAQVIDDEAHRLADLGNHAISLSNLGLHGQALQKITEVTQGYRTLVANDPERLLPMLATSLDNQSTFQSKLGDRIGALKTINEAVQHCRELVSKNRDHFLPNLARSLNLLSNRQGDLGYLTDALETINETVQLYREIVSKNRNAFLPLLAASLNNQSGRQGTLGNPVAALEANNEAVQHYRELVGKNRDAFLPGFASSLINQSKCQYGIGDSSGALETIKKAVQIYRDLVTRNRDAFLPDLAASLNQLSNCQGDEHDRVGALEAINEAVQIHRELVSKNRNAFLADLAGSLNNKIICQSNAGDIAGALESARESLNFYRELSARVPDAFALNHAISANNFSDRLLESDDPSKAATLAEEAVRILKPMFVQYPQAVADRMPKFLRNYLTRFAAVGLEPDPTLLEGLQHLLEDS
jgi:tetratricopeptide (TPR) repeat protein